MPLTPTMRRRRRIPARDRVLLSTWEKWVNYGRFPYKLVLHLALVALTTWQVVRFNNNDAAYVRAAHRNWYYYFFPAEYDFESRNFYLYTVSDTVDCVRRIATNYNKMVSTSVDQLSHPSEKQGSCLHEGHCTDGLLQVTRFPVAPRKLFSGDEIIHDLDDKTVKEEFWINVSDLGPIDLEHFTYEEVSDFIQSIIEMRLTYSLVVHGIRHSGRECLIWEVTVIFDFSQRGQIDLHLESRIINECTAKVTFWSMFSHTVHRINLAILVLSSLSLFLSSRSVLNSARLLFRFEQRFKKRVQEGSLRTPPPPLSSAASEASYAPLHEHLTPVSSTHRGGDDEIENAFAVLSFQDKMRFFNLWFVLTAVASIINIFNSLFGLFWNRRYSPTATTDKVLLGLGCSLLWVNLIAFLTHKPSYYTIVLTLSRAVPRVTRFLLGVLPILLGYALFGMLFFGDHSERFGSFGYSMITLFAVLNGDVIRETFMDLISFYPIVSQIYLYSFICLFIYVVLNVFIAIVEESFFSTRAKARSLELFAQQVRDHEHMNRPNHVQQHSSVDGNSQVGMPPSDAEGSTTAQHHLQSGNAHRDYNTFSVSQDSEDQSRISQHQYDWSRYPGEEQDHRRLRWFREVLAELEEES